jgi:hypothetical protein
MVCLCEAKHLNARPIMIDVAKETLVTFREGAKRFPARRRGKPVHHTTLTRWHHIGHLGVKLEALRLPSGWVTSLEALNRFATRLTEVSEGAPAPAMSAKRIQPRVSQRLDAEGF